ncbi:MAG: carbohydrate kinase [Planctomycetes bacterium]|nr:carbohydrate kinase [Planctomycetota bacterium]
MPKYLLGTDNGGTVSKAALFTLDGKEIAVAARQTELLTPKAGFVERDMAKMWTATAEAIKEVVTKSGVDPADIACVACTGHGNGIYLIDKDGEPTRNAIMSSDGRARSYIEKWTADGVDKAIRPKTMQCIWPAQPNALLAWIRDNEPDVLKKSAHVLMAKDFIRYRLTGEAYAELTDMSGCSLMNVGTGEYDADVLEAFGIGEMQRLLPPLKRTADICGQITSKAAELTGLKEGTPVAGGMFDIDACGLASGITDESQLCVVVGTWGNNQYISDKPVIDGVFMTSCYSIPGYYLMLEGSATSAGNLEWFVNQFFAAEKQLAKEQGRSVYDICNELVAATDPKESKVIFLPFLYGSNAGMDAKSCLVGMASHHSRSDVLRAIYEGVVFAHMTHMDNLKSFRNMPETIRLTGGAARSDVWLQIFADCFQSTVEIPDGTEQGTLGAAIAAGVAVGCFKDYQEAIDKMVSFSKRIEPNPEMKDLYQEKYYRYKKIIETLDPVWKDLG